MKARLTDDKFEGLYCMTLKEIGEVLGVSRQTVRTIEKSALNKVRENLKNSKWVNNED